jgi:Uma2 family endonuclease
MSIVEPRRWTKEEYYRLGDLGVFQDQRVELIEGHLVLHSPQSALHADTLDVVDEVLSNLFKPGYRVRCQLPIDLGQILEPEPDIAVVQGTRRQYRRSHPTSAVLIVEVSETTLAYDRGRKGSLYARANILDYWIVNLVDHQLEVYRDPVPDPNAHYGFRYANRTDLTAPATVTPLALPGASIPVADLVA